MIKFLNYTRRDFYGPIPVREAVIRFLEIIGYKNISEKAGNLELLMIMREMEKGNGRR